MTDKQIALVTGGTGGIGTEICKRLYDMGCQVVTTYRDEEREESWHKEMQEQGYDVPRFKCDVTDYDACEQLTERISKDFGPINILVNNAGIVRDSTLKKMEKEQWDDVIDSDLNSVFNLTKPVVNIMLEQAYGRIINVSSVNAQKGQFGQSNYSAAKAGMHGFTKALAQEVASKGITVNTVSPGYIDCGMFMKVPEEMRNKIIEGIPMGRLGKPEEIANVIAFLASKESSFITGSNIAANGGCYMA